MPVVVSLIISFLIAVVAFLTFCAICVQAGIYLFQLKEMKKSTDAATRAANSAEAGLKLARDHAHLDQRAWVATTGIHGKPEPDRPYILIIGVKNSGKTFAKKVTIRCHMRAVPKGKEPNFNEIPTMEPQSVALLPPNGEYASVSGDTKLSPELIDKIKAGDVVVFAFGEITYIDIFKCLHWTKFCSILDPVNWSYTVYKTHNDADENTCP
jgi:hypothetical protein